MLCSIFIYHFIFIIYFQDLLCHPKLTLFDAISNGVMSFLSTNTFSVELFNFSTWINSLWLSDAIWQHRSESTLTEVMVCFLMAPSNYLNQCWLIISEVLHHSPENFTASAPATILHNQFENYSFKTTATFPRGRWVNFIKDSKYETQTYICVKCAGIILGMGAANERRHYIVTSSPIGWTHTQKEPWMQLYQQ